MKKTLVITGATGFVGYNIVKRLAKDNRYKFYIIVRESTDLAGLKGLCKEDCFFTHDGSTEGMIDFFQGVGKIDAVLHLASLLLAEHKPQDIIPLIDSNIKLGTQVLEAMRHTGCRNIINSSTFAQHYNNEEYNPASLYAATKEAFEKIIVFFTEAYNISCVTLELLSVYGKGDLGKRILSLIHKTAIEKTELNMTPCEQLMDFVYIDDVVNAYLLTLDLLLNSNEKMNKRYLVATRVHTPLKDVIPIFEELYNEKLNINLGKRPYRNREIMKTWDGGEILPGWTPKTTLREGIYKSYTDNDGMNKE